MADRTPARRPDRPEPTPAQAPRDDAPRTGPVPLTERWWWTGGAAIAVGAVVIGWQWDVIGKGDAIPATWFVVALGAVMAVGGAVRVWLDRPSRKAAQPSDATDGPEAPGGE